MNIGESPPTKLENHCLVARWTRIWVPAAPPPHKFFDSNIKLLPHGEELSVATSWRISPFTSSYYTPKCLIPSTLQRGGGENHSQTGGQVLSASGQRDGFVLSKNATGRATVLS